MPVPQLPTHEDLWKQTLGWSPSPEQQTLFQNLYEQILDGNTRLNLTRITEPEEFWEKHLWDSVSGLAPWLAAQDDFEDSEASSTQNEPLRVIDIGTGGGFPGIPAAIALSPIVGSIDLALVDSTRKKILFLQELSQKLKLRSHHIKTNCQAIRAETLGQQTARRETYDLALIRAVGPAATCAEYALPLLKIDAQAVLFRGQWSAEDTEALLPVLDLLGGELIDLQSWQTPITEGQRHCLFVHKIAPTPDDLPRAVGVPGKTPLT